MLKRLHEIALVVLVTFAAFVLVVCVENVEFAVSMYIFKYFQCVVFLYILMLCESSYIFLYLLIFSYVVSNICLLFSQGPGKSKAFVGQVGGVGPGCDQLQLRVACVRQAEPSS